MAAKKKAKEKIAGAKAAKESFAFRAKVTRLGPMYVVEVPESVSKAVGVRGYVPIAGTLQASTPLRASLVPRGDGGHRILLNGEVRATAGIKLGDRVVLAIHVDHEPRGATVPDDIADALRDEGVLETFVSLAPGKKMHIIRWVDGAVHEETRAKRVARVVEVALGEREKRLDREVARATRGARVTSVPGARGGGSAESS